jgi:hypothetical protein
MPDGTSGYVLTAQGAGVDPAYAAPFSGYTEGARVYHSVDQSIPDITATYLAFDSERYDTDTIHDTTTNNSRLTCQTAGKYIIVFQATFAANATGKRHFWIRLNGTTNIAYNKQGLDSDNEIMVPVVTIYDLAVGDYVEAGVYQNSGGSLALLTQAQLSPEFMMQRVG